MRDYDENSPHCRECACLDCCHFTLNGGNCTDGCDECEGVTHIGFCPSFEEVEP